MLKAHNGDVNTQIWRGCYCFMVQAGLRGPERCLEALWCCFGGSWGFLGVSWGSQGCLGAEAEDNPPWSLAALGGVLGGFLGNLAAAGKMGGWWLWWRRMSKGAVVGQAGKGEGGWLWRRQASTGGRGPGRQQAKEEGAGALGSGGQARAVWESCGINNFKPRASYKNQPVRADDIPFMTKSPKILFSLSQPSSTNPVIRFTSIFDHCSTLFECVIHSRIHHRCQLSNPVLLFTITLSQFPLFLVCFFSLFPLLFRSPHPDTSHFPSISGMILFLFCLCCSWLFLIFFSNFNGHQHADTFLKTSRFSNQTSGSIYAMELDNQVPVNIIWVLIMGYQFFTHHLELRNFYILYTLIFRIINKICKMEKWKKTAKNFEGQMKEHQTQKVKLSHESAWGISGMLCYLNQDAIMNTLGSWNNSNISEIIASKLIHKPLIGEQIISDTLFLQIYQLEGALEVILNFSRGKKIRSASYRRRGRTHKRQCGKKKCLSECPSLMCVKYPLASLQKTSRLTLSLYTQNSRSFPPTTQPLLPQLLPIPAPIEFPHP
ncbi:hypothetical protein VP01_2076g1 [Puccinia sorghi]|uniref:Uncharacterized protein n=1 Tax=Puccinia sorghi TaxID=27349 RepID=A0A0L6VAN1_9BASI|nr:hypothetical protein VP01_2076g1 [Puccinia sorghi]